MTTTNTLFSGGQGVAVPSGIITEISAVQSGVNASVSGIVNLASILLNQGTYLIYTFQQTSNATTAGLRGITSLSLTSATEDTTWRSIACTGSTGNANSGFVVRPLLVTSSSQTIFLTGRGPDGAVTIAYVMFTVRIA